MLFKRRSGLARKELFFSLRLPNESGRHDRKCGNGSVPDHCKTTARHCEQHAGVNRMPVARVRPAPNQFVSFAKGHRAAPEPADVTARPNCERDARRGESSSIEKIQIADGIIRRFKTPNHGSSLYKRDQARIMQTIRATSSPLGPLRSIRFTRSPAKIQYRMKTNQGALIRYMGSSFIASISFGPPI